MCLFLKDVLIFESLTHFALQTVFQKFTGYYLEKRFTLHIPNKIVKLGFKMVTSKKGFRFKLDLKIYNLRPKHRLPKRAYFWFLANY